MVAPPALGLALRSPGALGLASHSPGPDEAVAFYANHKITTEHLIREAVVYMRVSTDKQVEHNQESLRYQFNLTRRASQLGWPQERTRVITEDLGVSAVYGARKGFWNLLNDTADGRIGIIFVFESSRATRKAGDMYALVDAAIVSGTLIADKQNIYDPRDFNDRMMLYLSGLFDEAEWHRFRMRGVEGRMLQVLRGAYRQRLPTGLLRLSDGAVEKEADPRVRETIELVFHKFRELLSCRKVLRELKRLKIQLPRFRYSGPDRGKLVWADASRDAILDLIGNPAYAGAFVYGRRHRKYSYAQREGKDGQAGKCVRQPMEDWIIVPDVYPAYITWEEYLSNRRRLGQLASDFQQLVNKSRGEAREGSALISKLARCGTCGARMKVTYNPGGRYFCDAQMANYGTFYCPSIHAKAVDAAVVKAFFEALHPSQVDALEAVTEKQNEEQEQTRAHLEQRVERARYEAQRAQTQYESVDPLNRLVAAELERRWEARLVECRQLEAEYEQLVRQQQSGEGLSHELQERLRQMSETLRELWEGGDLSNSQKKELLHGLIAGVVLRRVTADKTEVRIAWVSGNSSVIMADTPSERTSDLPSYEAMLGRIKKLWEQKLDDRTIAESLTEEGFHSARSQGVPPSAVKQIRLKQGWVWSPGGRGRGLAPEGYLTMTGLAGRLGVGVGWVSKRLTDGRIDPKYLAPHVRRQAWLIRDEPELIEQLRQEVSNEGSKVGSDGSIDVLSVRQHPQDTPVAPDLAAEEVVTVLDARHPLFGCSFPLVRMAGEDEGKRSCVVRLPGGGERLIPLEATDRAESSHESYPLPLSMEVVKGLLEIYQSVMSRRETVEEVECVEDQPTSEAEAEEMNVAPEENVRGEEAQAIIVPEIIEAEREDAAPPGSERTSVNVPKVDQPHQNERPRPSMADETMHLPQPQKDKLVRLGDVGQYLGVSQGMVARFVIAGAIKTMTNPLDRRLKLVSTRELDEFKRQLGEMQRERDGG